MKLAFIMETTYNSGGMERMLAVTANEMAHFYQVTVISAFNEGRKEFFCFAENVRRMDLGLRRSDYASFKMLKQAYREGLEEFLMKERFDVCVSLGSLEFFFLPQIQDGSKKVFWFHFALNYDLMACYASKIKIINHLVGWLRQKHRIWTARKYDEVVVLTKADCRQWHKYLKNVTNIYNPLTVQKKHNPDYNAHRAIAVGRIERQKGFDFLVDAWKIVHDRYPDWILDIYGTSSEGNIKVLQDQIDKNGLKDVVLMKGSSSDMAETYSQHSMMILSSRYEGLGLVLIEAATCGLPLISYDCQQGPSEIIENGRNGYLVHPVGNIIGLADAICSLIADENKRRAMGEEAERMSKQFSMEYISQDWRTMFDQLLRD